MRLLKVVREKYLMCFLRTGCGQRSVTGRYGESKILYGCSIPDSTMNHAEYMKAAEALGVNLECYLLVQRISLPPVPEASEPAPTTTAQPADIKSPPRIADGAGDFD
ncbi:hypothetical protein RUND412_001164 [Rhizina undulata]